MTDAMITALVVMQFNGSVHPGANVLRNGALYRVNRSAIERLERAGYCETRLHADGDVMGVPVGR